MDPTQCLLDILNSIDGCASGTPPVRRVRNRKEAIDGLRNLSDWLIKGGFAPKLQGVKRGRFGAWIVSSDSSDVPVGTELDVER